MADDSLQAIGRSSEACAACLRRMHDALDAVETVRHMNRRAAAPKWCTLT